MIFKRMTATLAGLIGMAALPAVAHAGVLVEYSTDGGATFTSICSSGTNACSGSALTGSFSITISSALSNAPGTVASSDLFTTTTQITNLTSSNLNLILRFGADGYTAPPNGLLESNLSGTSTTGGAANSETFISCAVAGGSVASHVPCPGGFQTAALSTNITGSSFSGSNTLAVASIGTPYALGQELNLTLNGSSNINFANSTDLVALPEPASMTLIATGLFGMAGFVRRRRKQS